jgi:hypothetical protein
LADAAGDDDDDGAHSERLEALKEAQSSHLFISDFALHTNGMITLDEIGNKI